MTRRVSTLALLRRELRPGAAAFLLAVLVAVAVLAVALAPRLLDRVGEAELHGSLDRLSPVTLDISGTGHLGLPFGSGETELRALVGETDTAVTDIARRQPAPLRAAIGDPVWLVRTPVDDLDAVGDRPRTKLTLVVDLGWESRIRFVDGTAPQPWAGSEDAEGPQPPIEVAFSTGSAEEIGLAVGDEIADGGRTLVVSGLYEPLDADDPYWAHTGDLIDPVTDRQPGLAPIVGTGAYVAPETLVGLQLAFSNGVLTVWLPVDPAKLSYADLTELAQQARNAPASGSSLPFGGTIGFRTGLADALDRVGARVASLSGLLALCVSGLAGVVVAVLALAIRALLDRHASALRLAVARGASGTQVRLVMLGLGVLVCLPPAALAVAVAVLAFPARIDATTWIAPVVVTAIPIALFGLLVTPASRATRGDLSLRRGGRPRLLAELLVVGLAVLAVVLLARRGLAAPAAEVGIDPLLSATPLLLAVAASVIVLRLYPVPLGAVRRGLRRRDGAVGMLGAARAERDPALGYLPALALIVGVAVVVSATVLAGTVRAGLAQAARESVGADLQISAPDLGDDVLADVRAVPGVGSVAALVIARGVPFRDGADDGGVTLVAVDTTALHAVRPDLPVISSGGSGPVPVLASDDWIQQLEGDRLAVGAADVAIAGSLPADALPGTRDHWLLVDASALDRLDVELPGPARVLADVAPGASPATVAAEVREIVRDGQTVDPDLPGVVVVRDVDDALDEARTPVIVALETGLLGVAGASLALTMLAVVLATVAAAGTRNRLIGVLRVLGMSRRQVRGLLAWELGPLAIASLVAGTALGLALPAVVTAALDLRPFLGGREQPGAVIDPLTLLAALGAFAVAVLLAEAVAVVLGRRLAPAGAIKMGEP